MRTVMIKDRVRLGCEKGSGKLISELKQATFLTTRTLTGSKFDVINQSTFLTQSFDVTHAVRVVKNVACLSSLLSEINDN